MQKRFWRERKDCRSSVLTPFRRDTLHKKFYWIFVEQLSCISEVHRVNWIDDGESSNLQHGEGNFQLAYSKEIVLENNCLNIG